VQGETPLFDYVCLGVTQGVMDVSLKFSKPIGFGVLTVNTVEQAIARCGRPESFEDKGFDSAVAAIELAYIAANDRLL
jgi:6,7-dimethyl-8-ribityllumazine synthase